METFDTILDWMIMHQVRLMQLSVQYQAQAQEELDKTEPELGRIAAGAAALITAVGGLRPDDTRTQAALDGLKQQALAVRRDGFTKAMQVLTPKLLELTDYERQFYSAVLKAGGQSVNVPAKTQVIDTEVMGQNMNQWRMRLLSNDVHRIQTGLTLGARLGEKEADLRVRLLGQARYGGRGGATAAARNELDTLVRTATDTFADLARVQVNMENPLTGSEIYVALLDARTTDKCKSLHGTIHGSNGGPRPPIHWYCRSTRVPLVGDGSRKIPRYRDWLNRLSTKDQNEVLGPRQGAAFRAGTLDLQNFSEPAWRGIDLETTAKRERRVFEAAGMDVPFQ